MVKHYSDKVYYFDNVVKPELTKSLTEVFSDIKNVSLYDIQAGVDRHINESKYTEEVTDIIKLPFIIYTFLALCGTLMSAWSFNAMLTGFMNPEYLVYKDIIELTHTLLKK